VKGREISNSTSTARQGVFKKAAGDAIADRIEAIALEVRGIGSPDGEVLASSETLSALASALQQSRRKIDEIFELDGFAVSPACDVVLELFQARVRGAPLSVLALCEALSCPSSVALRWLEVLESRQLLIKMSVGTESESVALTEKGFLRTARALQLHL